MNLKWSIMDKVKNLKIINEDEVSGFRGICGWVKELIDPNNSDVQNLNIALIIVEPGKSSLPHYHNKSEEIYYILDGEGELKCDNVVKNINKGCGIYIPDKSIHMIKNNGNKNLKILSINAPPYDSSDVTQV